MDVTATNAASLHLHQYVVVTDRRADQSQQRPTFCIRLAIVLS